MIGSASRRPPLHKSGGLLIEFGCEIGCDVDIEVGSEVAIEVSSR